MRGIFLDILGLAGMALIIAGFTLVRLEAGLIVAGLLLIGLGYILGGDEVE